MLKPIVAVVMAIAAIGAAPAPRTYDLRLTVSRDGTTLATPRLLARAGGTARFVTDDGAGNGWAVSMTPTPGAKTGTASVAVAIDVHAAHGNGIRDSQRMTVTVAIDDPGHGRFTVLPRPGVPGLAVGLAIASIDG